MRYQRLQPWLVCFSAALFFFFEFIQLNMFNAIGPSLTRGFGIDAAELASISVKYFLANIIFLFPAGMLLDRVSTRKAVLLGMLVSVLCTFGFAAAGAVWQMKLARFITGIAGSLCLLSCVRLASRWFAPRQMALVVGLIVTFAMTGGMVAQTPLALLIKAYGWRATVAIDASLGLLLLVPMFIFIKDKPKHPIAPGIVDHTTPTGRAFWQVLRMTLTKPQNWLAGLYTSLMNLPVFLFGAIWGIFYLTQVHHLSSEDASFVTLMLFVGLIIGSPVVGWFSDNIRLRKLPMIIGAVASLVIILVLMFVTPLSMGSLIACFFLLGFFTSTQIISYPLIAESNSLSVTATAEGMASVLIMGGGYSQDLFAHLMGYHWHHVYVNGVPHYSLFNYRIGLSIMPIAFIISIMIAFFLRETHCKHLKESHEHQSGSHAND